MSASDSAGAYSFQFLEEHRSGDEAIDKEHEELFSLANEIFEASMAMGARERLERLLEELFEVLSSHFATEEEAQRVAGYPQAGIHARQHAELLSETRRLVDLHRQGLVSFGDLFRFIGKDVVVRHFETADSQFHRFLAASTVK